MARPPSRTSCCARCCSRVRWKTPRALAFPSAPAYSKAACCRLSFALSLSDLEIGKVKWDFGKPYYIRHTASGHCVHLDQGSCHCGVYDHRPKICRGYSCQDDQRIWIDFDNMVLNQEWIDQHLGGEKLVLKTNELSQKKKAEG